MFFDYALEYQNKRKEIVDAYQTRMNQLENSKGSQFYISEAEKATETRDSALSALKSAYSIRFDDTIEAMSKANSTRGIVAPTTEELNIVQALKMREKVTQSELDAAANSLKSSPLCLSVLTELGQKNGFARGYMNYAEIHEMPSSDVEMTLRGIVSELRDFMEYDTSKAARLGASHHSALYGGEMPALAKRPLFYDKEECFSQLAGLSGDALKAFIAAVDG